MPSLSVLIDCLCPHPRLFLPPNHLHLAHYFVKYRAFLVGPTSHCTARVPLFTHPIPPTPFLIATKPAAAARRISAPSHRPSPLSQNYSTTNLLRAAPPLPARHTPATDIPMVLVHMQTRKQTQIWAGQSRTEGTRGSPFEPPRDREGTANNFSF